MDALVGGMTLQAQLEKERASRRELESELERARAELQNTRHALRDLADAQDMLRREALNHRQTMRELTRARDQAERASQRKSDFVSQLSHEFRTPLTAILGYAEIMLEDAADGLTHPDELLQDLEAIRTSGGHMLELINGLLDLAKIESGAAPMLLEEVSVSSLLAGLVPFFKPLVDPAQSFKCRCDTRLDQIVTDRIKLCQILTNLLSNALKFTPRGAVSLTARRAGPDHVRFDVEDDGIGMSEEALGRVFDAFEQAESTTQRDYGGTGLGLTLCQKLSEMLGGKLHVRSSLGEGTTFSLIIPRDRTA